MTRQQKREIQLQKEIRKLKQENFLLTKQNKDLQRQIVVWQRDYRSAIDRVNELYDDLNTATRRAFEAEEKAGKILDEVHRYVTTDAWTYLEQKAKKL